MSGFDDLNPPYGTVVVDPPWRFESAATKADARKHYSTMSLGEICRLPVRALTDESAHLWLWAVNGLLEEAFVVVRSWGFRPTTILTWCKPQPGVGHYLRNNTEHCLFATRGKPVVPEDKPMAFLVRLGPRGAQRQACGLLRPRRAGVARASRRAVLPHATIRLGYLGRGV